jgi:hypothetical protein
MNIKKLFTEYRMNSLLVDIMKLYNPLQSTTDILINDSELLTKYDYEINFFYDEKIIDRFTKKLNITRYSIFRNYSQ